MSDVHLCEHHQKIFLIPKWWSMLLIFWKNLMEKNWSLSFPIIMKFWISNHAPEKSRVLLKETKNPQGGFFGSSIFLDRCYSGRSPTLYKIQQLSPKSEKSCCYFIKPLMIADICPSCCSSSLLRSSIISSSFWGYLLSNSKNSCGVMPRYSHI